MKTDQNDGRGEIEQAVYKVVDKFENLSLPKRIGLGAAALVTSIGYYWTKDNSR